MIKKTEIKKQLITEKVADYLLAHGLQKASLRSIAAAAETSDRMLLHYFVNKEELLAAALKCVTERLVALLESTQPEPMPYEVFLPQIAAMLKDPRIQPHTRLWLELAAFSAGGETFYRTIARQAGDMFLDWITSALKVDQEADRQSVAALALAMMEGFVLLDALDYNSLITDALEGIAVIR